MQEKQQSSPVSPPSPPEPPDSQSPAIPDSRAAPSARFPLSPEMLWGPFRGGRFILPGGNRIISLPSFPRGNPVSFPCSGGEEVAGLALTVPGGQWIPPGGGSCLLSWGIPMPKEIPPVSPEPRGSDGTSVPASTPAWVGVLAREGQAAPAHGWCCSKAPLIQH